MQKYLHLSLCLLLLILPPAMRGEYFRHLTLGDGLSQPSVLAITQDKLGRMWLGTKEGVNIFDGVGITPYKGWVTMGNEKDKVWIGNEVSSIITDSIGNIFIMIDKDIVKYDIYNDRFSRFTTNADIKAIAQYNGEVTYIAGDSIKIKNIQNDITKFAFIIPSLKGITHLTVNKNQYYISTQAGLHVFDRKTHSHKILLPQYDIYSSFISRDGILWITTVNNGLYRLAPNGSKPVAVSAPTVPEGILGAQQCRNAIEDSHGRIWYGSFSGLFCYDPSSGKTRHIKIPLNIGGLTHTSVYGMYCDRKGNLWVGTYYGGVNYFSPDHDKFLNFNYDSFVPENLSHSFVKDMIVDRENNLWFAIDGAGVGCLDHNWNTITQLSTREAGKALRQNNVRCLGYDPGTNRLFIGTHLGGLSVYDIKKKKVTNLIDMPRYQKTPGYVIHQLKVRDENLFISSRSGLSFLNLSSGIIKECATDIMPKMFDLDKEGNIYCTSAVDYGLYKISNPTGTNPVTTQIAAPDKKRFPTQVCATDKGVLLSTLGNGLFFYPYDNSPVEHISTSNSRLPDDYCYAISRGTGDIVYVTTENNVVKLDMSDRSIQAIRFSELFPESHIINGGALLSLDNGDIFVGSTKGITRLNSRDFNVPKITDNSSGIFFSKLRVQNKDIIPGDGILEKALPFSDRILLPSDINSFSIIIGCSDYVAATGVSPIEYRMDGIDDNWISASGNEISYKNLPSGSYRLHARQPGGKEIAIDVTIATPWYNTWPAWVVYIAAAFCLGYFIINKTLTAARLRQLLRNEKREKEQIEKVNQEKFVFFTNVSHEFQTPLTLIISHIDILISRYKRHTGLIEALTKVRKHSEQMSHLITQLLEFRKLQQNRQILRIGMHDANETLKENASPFCEHAIQRGISFTITPCAIPPRGAYDPALINRVLVNLLSNAFKYTPDGGSISCSVKTGADGDIVFEVEDNGRGIDEKDLPYIFDRFYNGSTDELKRFDIDYRSTGIGLAFAKSIVDRHHGSISVRSQVGAGTVFSVVLPSSIKVFENDANIVYDGHSKEASEYQETPLSPMSDRQSQYPQTYKADMDSPLLLIVEDNSELRNNLVEFFSTYFRTAEADNGEDGLQKARELSPDIIISDVMMPRMSGTEMCRLIKSDIDMCHIPVILLTALSATESIIEGLNTNADDYVTKPFESTLLLARIDNLLRLRTILRKQFEKQPVNEIDMSLVNPLDRDLLKRTTALIEKNIANLDFDIPMLCREVGVSRSLFFNKFKSLTGMTPNTFILNYRLKYAAALLTAQPHLTITEVADRCGFATAIYFSRCFKKQFGVSPLVYRKQATESKASETQPNNLSI